MKRVPLIYTFIILAVPFVVSAKKSNIPNFNMIEIPAGSFDMGSIHALDSARPVHAVNVPSFKIMQTEVAWELYQSCIDMGGCLNNEEFGGDEGWGKDNRPVINVNFQDITEQFIPWLNKQTGEEFKLPSEAQWEYATRAGSAAKFSWGNEIDCSKANYDGGEGEKCEYDIQGGERGTLPVKSFEPNAFGLYDMHGNVWEWVQDCWNKNYIGAPINGDAWLEGNCNFRQVRGGAWVDPEKYLRSGDRNRNWVKTRINMMGFRLVQDIQD
ncbi:MAG: formylglycine-generating enzyme family protein [Saccharospirillaceae bacterium]|nr:formylglycine-generating enzyme family protein [Saccharospirillaceae bacterium]